MDQVFSRLLVVQFLLVSAAFAKTLYFQPKTELVCPDNKHSCNSDTTCCLLPDGKYGCCMYANAVCCSDNIHCCPTGSYCDVNTGSCDKEGVKFEWSRKAPASLYIPKVKNQPSSAERNSPLNMEFHQLQHQQQPESIPWALKLPGLKLNSLNFSSLHAPASCSVSQTLCKSDSGLSGCCPFPNAVCCDKGQQCCPSGFQCNLKSSKCEKPTEETTKEMSTLQPGHTLFALIDPAVCPDVQTVCPKNMTCCSTGNETYACCPSPGATCCDDHIHCCAHGYTCGTTKCIKKQVDMILVKMTKWTAGQTCPDMETTCPEGTTCCPLQGGAYGCCPYPQAVCCSDNYHCCPRGYTCDVRASKCQIISKGLTCPDHQTQCSGGMTCCLIEEHLYGCCPFPQATCCSDDKHCCPKGYTCELKTSQCVLGSSQIQLTEQMIVCPDKSTQCPSSSTCCPLSEGGYGCCPYVKATCCTDDKHCCPEGYTCDVKASQCVRGSSQIQLTEQMVVCPDKTTQCPSSSTCCPLSEGGYGCCPYVKATCCTDDTHCCPEGYTCDVKASQCVRGSSQIQLTEQMVVCPDKSTQCPSSSTCCPLSEGGYGCCPYVKATCCTDDKHCCPEGYTCDVKASQCVRGSSQIQLTEQMVVCPDKSTQCPSSSTCCPLSEGGYGCCPYVKATCCTDDKHCCPEGYTCDLKASQCVRGSSQIQLTEQMVVCPDKSTQCPSSSTCCPLQNGGYGCCPYVKAVCCEDHLHCCPNDYTCDIKIQKCMKHGTGSVELSVLQSGIQTSASVICSDNTHCSAGTTCCPVKGGNECCPIPEAKCCPDMKHCCPDNFICDTVRSRCRIETKTKTPAKPISLTSLSVTNVTFSCPDSQCPSGSTCCPISSIRFGCCPLPKAVCCQDNKHCCPKNYHCDLEHKRCVMGQTSLPLFEKFLPSKSLTAMEPAKKTVKFVMCPDYSECPDRNTCCLMNTGAWGCCPFVNAVCCDDHLHCCPSDYTCDIKAQKCMRHGTASVELSVVQSGIQTSASVECSHCSAGTTCCPVKGGHECCPFPEAVCCIDREHCCPKTYFCDMEQSKCVSAKSSLNPMFSMFYLNLKP